jgi:hypothetical protein
MERIVRDLKTGKDVLEIVKTEVVRKGYDNLTPLFIKTPSIKRDTNGRRSNMLLNTAPTSKTLMIKIAKDEKEECEIKAKRRQEYADSLRKTILKTTTKRAVPYDEQKVALI